MIKNDKSVDSIIDDQATNIWFRVLLPVISRSKGKQDMQYIIIRAILYSLYKVI